MKHLLFILYTLSVISGILSIGFYVSLYFRKKSESLKSFLLLLYSFSAMIFCGAGAVYMATNVSQSIYVSGAFVVGIMIGIHSISYALPFFIHASYNVAFNPIWRKVFRTILQITPIPVFVYLLTLKSVWSVCPLIFSFAGFFVSLCYIGFMIYQNREKTKKTMSVAFKMTIAIFSVISFLAAFIETFYLGNSSSLHGLSVVLPLIYLFFNVVFMIFRIDDGGGLVQKVILDIASFAKKCNLTDKEIAVVKLITEGKSNKEIAHLLCISPHTVKNHISNTFAKTNVQNRTSLIYKIQNP